MSRLTLSGVELASPWPMETKDPITSLRRVVSMTSPLRPFSIMRRRAPRRGSWMGEKSSICHLTRERV